MPTWFHRFIYIFGAIAAVFTIATGSSIWPLIPLAGVLGLLGGYDLRGKMEGRQ